MILVMGTCTSSHVYRRNTKKDQFVREKLKVDFGRPASAILLRGKDGGTGTERSLTYYSYRDDRKPGEKPKPIKTHWLMREYMLKRPKNDKESMVGCKVKIYISDAFSN